MAYTPPTLNQSYTSNSSIYQNAALENSVFKLSHIFLDYLFPNNVLPQDLFDQLIDNPDDIEDILGKHNYDTLYSSFDLFSNADYMLCKLLSRNLFTTNL